jgi:hypothetical protein
MATMAALTCVGCGKKFEGDKDMVPEFTSGGGGGMGAGGHMCQECFNKTNALRSGAGLTPLTPPPAGTWGEYITEAAEAGTRSALKRK